MDGVVERDTPGAVVMRHVMLNDMLSTAPGTPLGIDFGVGRERGARSLAITRACVWQGSGARTAAADECDDDGDEREGAHGASAAGGDAGAAAAAAATPVEPPLIEVGDYVVGVSGASVEGMSVAQLDAVVAAVRASTPSGVIILHLSKTPIFVDESVRLQMAQAARQLLGSQAAVVAAYQPQWQVIYGAARERER